MERSEPTLIPEWLRNAGNSPGGGATSNSDNHSSSCFTRNKSFVNNNVTDLGKSSFERTTSSYFRHGTSGNGSGRLRSHGSFGKNHRDRDWDREKDKYDPREKDYSLLSDRCLRDFPEQLGDTLTSKFDKDGLRRSQSMISGKRGETWPKKLANDLCNGSHNNGVPNKGSTISEVNKQIFERDFPSLGADTKTVASEIGRVPSPGLGALQNFPNEKWTSALAEVPVLAESNGSATSSQLQNSPSGSKPVASGLNMAEAVVLGPSRAQTPPQLSVGTQRLEELAIKQSKQLIPMTPSLPKTLALCSDKQKSKSTQQLFPQSSPLILNQSPRGGGPVKSDVSKTSNSGKLHVLIQGRDKNSVSSVFKDNSSPKSGGKAVNSVIASSASALHSSASAKVSHSSSVPEHKPVLTLLDKNPALQARSRNDFFNSVRKQSMGNNSSSLSDSSSETSLAVQDTSPSLSDKVSDVNVATAHDSPKPKDVAIETNLRENNSSVDKAELMTCNGDMCVQRDVRGKKNPNPDPIISEEEEAAFLRSLGWDENNDEGGLTEEEINAFYRDLSKYINSNTSPRTLQGVGHKIMVPFDSQIGGVGNAQLES